eukprot:XP_025007092.1 cardiotrophin-like cytokine factor 1 isoform X2 [Gallus gallus]
MGPRGAEAGRGRVRSLQAVGTRGPVGVPRSAAPGAVFPSGPPPQAGLPPGLSGFPQPNFGAAALLQPQRGGAPRLSAVPVGDSWGIFAFLCAALCNLPAVPALNGTEELGAGQSIQKTYDLTRYLEHQLRTLAGTYLNYLGPPFNEPDFNPPRLARAERVPSATVDLDLWRGLTDNARLAANYRAYSRLLCYLRGLDGQVGTVELRHRLGHFCSSLQGLVLSIAGVMSSLGYPLPAGPAGPPPPPGAPAAPNNFLKKMDDFWLLKELQTWLWRSAKDFNRLKKKVPPAVVTLRIEARGF